MAPGSNDANAPRRAQETVLLACPVVRDLVDPRLRGSGIPQIYMDYGLHLFPERMAPALQQQLDALPGPRTVLIGYGLCGTGLAGLEAGPHTLIIPRADDCIAILLGSHERYQREQGEQPGTYYLTRGWIEAKNHPLGQYEGLAERYGKEAADHVLDTLFANYTRLLYVAATQEELVECRPRVREVAEFCAARLGMSYDERVGSAELIEKLLDARRGPADLAEDLLVIPPGGRVESRMFLRT